MHRGGMEKNKTKQLSIKITKIKFENKLKKNQMTRDEIKKIKSN